MIYQLVIKPLFDRLTTQEKLYAHYMSKAAWYGSRILWQQTSPEGPLIFDFVIALYRACDGQWARLADESGVTPDELDEFLNYSALFLSNMGNFYVMLCCKVPVQRSNDIHRAQEIRNSFQISLKSAWRSLQLPRQKQRLS
jgi:dipeptidyl-peptidase-3